jgi:hypothetical protein
MPDWNDCWVKTRAPGRRLYNGSAREFEIIDHNNLLQAFIRLEVHCQEDLDGDGPIPS